MKTSRLILILLALASGTFIKTFGQDNHCQASFTYLVSYDFSNGSAILQFANTSGSSDSIITYDWSFSDGTTSQDKNPSHSFALPGVDVVCLSIATEQGCQSTKCDTIILPGGGNACNISAAWTDSISANNNGLVMFYGPSGNGDGVVYYWSFGDGLSGAGLNVSHLYLGPGTYTVCLLAVKAGTTCADTICQQIQVTITPPPPPPGCHANFIFHPSSAGDSARTITFTNTSTSQDSITNYTWSFGDGSTSHDANVTHTYAQSGTYVVCLEISNDSCQSSKCDTIIVPGANPCAGLSAAWTYTVASSNNGRVEFHGPINNSPGVSYYWSFGDGTSDTGLNVTHTYADSGAYTVCLIATLTGTGCADTSCGQIHVLIIPPPPPSCNANFTYLVAPPSPNVNGITVYFTNLSIANDSISAYNWSFGDDSTSNHKNPVHTFAGPGTYVVCLAISTTGGCQSSKCDTIVLASPCAGLNAQWSYTSANSNNTVVSFRGSPNDGSYATYNWNFGDGTTGTGFIVTHAFTHSGTYNVCLVVSIPGTACADTECKEIQVNVVHECHANFSFVQSDGGLTVKFISTSLSTDSITSYSWDFGDGDSSDQKNPIHIYAQSGTYVACLTINTAGECESTKCDTIVATAPNPCAGLSAAWTDTVSGGNNGTVLFRAAPSNHPHIIYSWNFGDGSAGTGPDPIHGYAESGVYEVCLIARIDGTPCADTSCSEIDVNVVPVCHARFAYVQTSPLNIKFINYSTSSDSIISFSWNFGDGATSSDRDPSHEYGQGGIYDVCLTITLLHGCSSTACDTVYVDQNTANCQASFTWSFIEGNSAGVHIQFTNTSTGGYTNSTWTFSDGSLSDNPNPLHIFASIEPFYIACLTVSNNTGTCYSSVCDTVPLISDSCVNYNLINTDTICATIYEPVCGCNGVTYGNACIAQFRHGITSWTPGPCQGPPGGGGGNAHVDLPNPGNNETGGAIEPVTGDGFEFNMYPNPAGDKTNIVYALTGTSTVNIEAMDMLGHTVAVIYNGNQQAGQQTLGWSTGSMANGIYLVRIELNGKTYTQKLSIIH